MPHFPGFLLASLSAPLGLLHRFSLLPLLKVVVPSLVTRGRQIKTTTKQRHTPITMAKLNGYDEKTDHIKYWQGLGATRTLVHAVEGVT